MRKNRGCQLPKEWVPQEPHISYGLVHGLTVEQVQREGEKFKNWAHAKGEVKKDWGAAWRNWVLRVCEEKGIPMARVTISLSDEERERLIRKYSKK